jgi:hypothetical protein
MIGEGAARPGGSDRLAIAVQMAFPKPCAQLGTQRPLPDGALFYMIRQPVILTIHIKIYINR